MSADIYFIFCCAGNHPEVPSAKSLIITSNNRSDVYPQIYPWTRSEISPRILLKISKVILLEIRLR